MAQGDDKLPWGAAAPASARRIESQHLLDASWAAVAATAVIASSFFDLVDLPSGQLSTSSEALRVFAIGVPLIAIALAAVGFVRRSDALIAGASGVLASSFALVGSLAASLFFSNDAAFADVGVAVSLAAAAVGVVMLVRWFVYHPDTIREGASRPPAKLAGLLAVGGAVAGGAVVWFWASDNDDIGLAQSAALVGALITPISIVVAAAVRTRASFALACAAALGQVAAIIVARWENDAIALDGALALWSSWPGLVILVIVGAAAAAGQFVHEVDIDEVVDDAGDESWRWTLDD